MAGNVVIMHYAKSLTKQTPVTCMFLGFVLGHAACDHKKQERGDIAEQKMAFILSIRFSYHWLTMSLNHDATSGPLPFYNYKPLQYPLRHAYVLVQKAEPPKEIFLSSIHILCEQSMCMFSGS